MKKTTDNKVVDIDVEGVKKAVNFRKETHFIDKPIDNYCFVIKEDGESNTASLAPATSDIKNYDTNSITDIIAGGINGDQSRINKSNDHTTDVIYGPLMQILIF